MSKIITFIRHEVVILAGVLTAALSFVGTNEKPLAAIIPLVVSLITRSQVSPVAKLQQLLKLIGELQAQKPAVVAVRKPGDPL